MKHISYTTIVPKINKHNVFPMISSHYKQNDETKCIIMFIKRGSVLDISLGSLHRLFGYIIYP